MLWYHWCKSTRPLDRTLVGCGEPLSCGGYELKTPVSCFPDTTNLYTSSHFMSPLVLMKEIKSVQILQKTNVKNSRRFCATAKCSLSSWAVIYVCEVIWFFHWNIRKRFRVTASVSRLFFLFSREEDLLTEGPIQKDPCYVHWLSWAAGRTFLDWEWLRKKITGWCVCCCCPRWTVVASWLQSLGSIKWANY